MEQLILVVDFGTSNVHVNMVNCENGEILFSASEKYSMICPQSGYVELDPDEMWEKSQSGVEKVIVEMCLSGKAYRVEALSFSFFGDNIIPADENGNALYHLIQCFDVRGKSQAEQLNLAVGEEKLIQVTGDICESTSCSSKIRYILEEMPDVGRRAVRFYNIQQFILHRLGLPPVNDLTMACTKRMVDLEHEEWYEPLLKEVGITKRQLGRIVNSQDVIGKVDSYGRVKFPEPVSVIPGAHDCDCGWLGVGVTDEKQDVIGNITGTFEHFGFLASGYRNVYASHPQWGLYSYRGPLKDTSVMLTAFDTSGALVEWFMREIYRDTSQAAYARLWEQAEFTGKNMVRIRPDFGANAGCIEGLNLGASLTDIFAGIMEALTFESRRLLEICGKAKKGRTGRVRIGGGGAKSADWVQLRANITGKTYECMEENEVSSIGAAILAAAAVGIYPDVNSAAEHMVQIRKVYHPDSKVYNLYQERYQEFIGTYRQPHNTECGK